MVSKKLIATLIALVAAGPVLAEGNYLDKINEMEAQIELLRKKAELNEEIKKTTTTDNLPYILSIVEDPDGMSAQIIFTSGLTRWVKQGDFVQDGLKVISISGSAVTVGGKKSRYTLPFMTAPTQSQPSMGMTPFAPAVNLPMPGGAPNMAVPGMASPMGVR